MPKAVYNKTIVIKNKDLTGDQKIINEVTKMITKAVRWE